MNVIVTERVFERTTGRSEAKSQGLWGGFAGSESLEHARPTLASRKKPERTGTGRLGS